MSFLKDFMRVARVQKEHLPVHANTVCSVMGLCCADAAQSVPLLGSPRFPRGSTGAGAEAM